jgi:hypothetical protein
MWSGFRDTSLVNGLGIPMLSGFRDISVVKVLRCQCCQDLRIPV